MKTEIYGVIKEVASLTHGKAEIELDESKGVCYITLYTKFIFLDDSLGISSSCTSELLKLSIWSKISIEDEFIKAQFMFDINKHIKVADYSDEINKLKNELKGKDKH